MNEVTRRQAIAGLFGALPGLALAKEVPADAKVLILSFPAFTPQGVAVEFDPEESYKAVRQALDAAGLKGTEVIVCRGLARLHVLDGKGKFMVRANDALATEPA